MTKKSDSSWFQFDSNVECTVTHIRKRMFSKLACYVIFPDHLVLRMRIGNLISISKFYQYNQMLREKIISTLNRNGKTFLKPYHLPYEEQWNYLKKRVRQVGLT